MAGFFKSLTRGYVGDKPDAYTGEHDSAIGAIGVEFEAFTPNPLYVDTLPPPTTLSYPTNVPKNQTGLPPIDPILKRLIESLWKRAEPAAGATRGAVQIGSRGGTVTPQRDAYRPQTRGAATITDMDHIGKLARINAITFRGDTRSPQALLVGNGKSGGFTPPNSRTDDFYIYGAVFNGFKIYMKSRFGVDITMADYVSAIAGSAPSAQAKHVLADYMMWRAVMESEAMHTGRMVADEFLKAYISTSRSLAVARSFAHAKGNMVAWFYITRVRGGFVIPDAGVKWGTIEQEIAQFGPIPPADILGFRKSFSGGQGNHWAGTGPIYIRRDFRKSEPDAFAKAFNMLSGWVP